MDVLTSLASLGTAAVAVTMTLIIVQYLKPLLPTFDTRLMCLAVAVVLTQIGAAFMGSGVEQHMMALLNAFIVATSAMGTYEITFKRSDAAKKAGNKTNNPPSSGALR